MSRYGGKDWEVPKKERAGSSGEAGCSKSF